MQIILPREYKDQTILKRVAAHPVDPILAIARWLTINVLELTDLIFWQVRELEDEEMLKDVALHFE